MKPWHRTPQETSKAYGYFQTYLLQGANREQKGVAESVGTTVGNINQVAQANSWNERAIAYDNHLMDSTTSAWEQQARDINKKHLTVASFVFGKLAQVFKDMKFDNLTTGEKTRMFEVMVKAERDATGIADVIAHEIATPELKEKIFVVRDDDEANKERIKKLEQGLNGRDKSDESI